MTISQLLTAIERNNDAATLLESNTSKNTKDAIVELQKALSFAKQTMRDSQNQEDEFGTSTESLDHCMINTSTINNENYSGTGFDKLMKDAGPSTYWHPIHISQNMTSSKSQLNIKIAAIIVFNLALAHHMEAFMMSGTLTNHATLRKTAQLYKHAHHIMRNITTDNNLLFGMTVMNNLGSVFQSLGAINYAEECFRHLLSTMMLMIDYGNGHVLSYFCDGLFFHNVSHLLSKSVAARAA